MHPRFARRQRHTAQPPANSGSGSPRINPAILDPTGVWSSTRCMLRFRLRLRPLESSSVFCRWPHLGSRQNQYTETHARTYAWRNTVRARPAHTPPLHGPPARPRCRPSLTRLARAHPASEQARRNTGIRDTPSERSWDAGASTRRALHEDRPRRRLRRQCNKRRTPSLAGTPNPLIGISGACVLRAGFTPDACTALDSHKGSHRCRCFARGCACRRFTAYRHFTPLCRYAGLRPIFSQYLQRGQRILVAGCGNSRACQCTAAGRRTWSLAPRPTSAFATHVPRPVVQASPRSCTMTASRTSCPWT